MATEQWETVQIRTCAKVTKPIRVDQKIVYPIDFLPDPPRVVEFRCSGEEECKKQANVNCIVPEEAIQAKTKP